MDRELKPCPFCGGEAVVHMGLQATKDIEIRCSVCAASTGNYDDSNDENENQKEATESWNRRAPDPVAADLVEALGECADRLEALRQDGISDLEEEVLANARALLAAQREG